MQVTGLGALIVTPLVGNLSDKYGRKALLTLPTTITILPLGTTAQRSYAIYLIDFGQLGNFIFLQLIKLISYALQLYWLIIGAENSFTHITLSRCWPGCLLKAVCNASPLPMWYFTSS